MIKLTSKEKFETSLGLIFVVENPPLISKGENVVIDGQEYKIKGLIFPTRPTNRDMISIVV